MTSTTSITSAVTSLQEFLIESARDGATTSEVVRERATNRAFPYPELAAQVFDFLQQKRVRMEKGLELEDVSEAFISLILDQDAVEKLGTKGTTNPWLAVRTALRNIGNAFGSGLIEVYEVVRRTGLGYMPTLLDLATELGALFAKLAEGKQDGVSALRAAGKTMGLESWKIALAVVFYKRRGRNLEAPTDRDLEEFFSDPAAQKALAAELPEGPWDVYLAQAQALMYVRHFGKAMRDLGDAKS